MASLSLCLRHGIARVLLTGTYEVLLCCFDFRFPGYYCRGVSARVLVGFLHFILL
jgi:hypothetical protein